MLQLYSIVSISFVFYALNERVAHFDVKLLMTPVVVSYWCASSKIAAIPISRTSQEHVRHLAALRTKTTWNQLLTDSRVEVGNEGGHRNNEQMQRFALITPL